MIGIGFSVRVRVAGVDSNTDKTVTYAIPVITGVSPQGLDAGTGLSTSLMLFIHLYDV